MGGVTKKKKGMLRRTLLARCVSAASSSTGSNSTKAPPTTPSSEHISSATTDAPATGAAAAAAAAAAVEPEAVVDVMAAAAKHGVSPSRIAPDGRVNPPKPHPAVKAADIGPLPSIPPEVEDANPADMWQPPRLRTVQPLATYKYQYRGGWKLFFDVIRVPTIGALIIMIAFPVKWQLNEWRYGPVDPDTLQVYQYVVGCSSSSHAHTHPTATGTTRSPATTCLTGRRTTASPVSSGCDTKSCNDDDSFVFETRKKQNQKRTNTNPRRNSNLTRRGRLPPIAPSHSWYNGQYSRLPSERPGFDSR